ncbi:MAG: lycopene cyclase domain-containing protein [Sphingobacteriales bacterium]|nr:MAG: lycopene cyclase domain-containing protein [Sphingobacteriales bacterium]
MKPYTYFLLHLFTISFPLARSFEPRIRFVEKWRYLFPATLFAALIFIGWDIVFTRLGVWSFNPDYLTGLKISVLPVEEWLFFFTVPYACMFIYEVIRYFFPDFTNRIPARTISIMLIVILLVAVILNFGKLYTTVCFSVAILLLLMQLMVVKGKYMGRFYLTYFVSLIPFLLVNGVLTALPVVSYHPDHIIGFRIYTIPIEDTVYNLSLLLMVVSIYEYLLNKTIYRSSLSSF